MKISTFKLPETVFLSNMYPCPVVYKGVAYKCSESAFQAAKCAKPEDAARFPQLDGYAAKRLSRMCPRDPHWTEKSIQVMTEILRAKFTQNPDLEAKLLETGDAELVEGNSWGDTFWGVCNGEGENHLGKCLMEIREELKKCKEKRTAERFSLEPAELEEKE